jgi:hypothetical protein
LKKTEKSCKLLICSTYSSSSTHALQQAKAHGRLRAVAVTKTHIHSLFNNFKTDKILQNLIT